MNTPLWRRTSSAARSRAARPRGHLQTRTVSRPKLLPLMSEIYTACLSRPVRIADTMVHSSTRTVARTFTTRLLLFSAVIVAFIAIALVIIISRATGGSAEQHSSPPFPVGALVWEKLEGATPIHKPCTAVDPSLIRKALDAGECSAILVQGGQFRLVNRTLGNS